MTWWRSASTQDRIVSLFAVTVAALLIIDTIALIIITAFDVGADVSVFATVSSDIVAMMLGALLGYVGGRQTQG